MTADPFACSTCGERGPCTHGVTQPPVVVPLPTPGELATLLSALTAYGMHTKRMSAQVAHVLAVDLLKQRQGEEWRTEPAVCRLLEAFDRAVYQARRTA